MSTLQETRNVRCFYLLERVDLWQAHTYDRDKGVAKLGNLETTSCGSCTRDCLQQRRTNLSIRALSRAEVGADPVWDQERRTRCIDRRPTRKTHAAARGVVERPLHGDDSEIVPHLEVTDREEELVEELGDKKMLLKSDERAMLMLKEEVSA